MTVDTKITIGEIVAEDFRTASVFSKYGIDFCCKGQRTLEEVCEKKNISVEELTERLSDVASSSAGQTIDYQSWPSDLLIDYIEKKHHRYIEEKTPVLLQYLSKLCKVHGERHPELFTISDHLPIETPHFGTVENPVAMMKHEHTVEGERVEEIAKLTNNYNPPADGCSTYKVTFAMLKEFEEDLHTHIHLENNILFPRAIAIEKQFQH